MKNINNELLGFHGSETFTKFGNFIYTEGVKALVEQFKCYWLLDLICSHQLNPFVEQESFQVWALKRIEKDEFEIVCDDGNGNIITTQNIPFSDIKGDALTIWFTNNTILLPSEY